MLQLRVFMLQVKKRSSHATAKDPASGLVTQSCLTLCNPTDCSPPGFSVHGILQSRILEWIAVPFSRESSPSRDGTLVLLHCRQILYHLNYRKVLKILYAATKRSCVLQWKLNIGHATTKTQHSQINKQIYSCPVFPALLIEETVFSPLYILASFVID